MTTTKNFTVRETAHIDGGAYRWVEFADGSARVEEWRGGKWVPGGETRGAVQATEKLRHHDG